MNTYKQNTVIWNVHVYVPPSLRSRAFTIHPDPLLSRRFSDRTLAIAYSKKQIAAGFSVDIRSHIENNR